MRSRFFLIAALLVMLGSVPAPAAAQGLMLPVSGTISMVNPAQRTLELGDTLFHVPEGVPGFEDLTVGTTVEIKYKTVNGKAVVTALSAADPA